MSGDDRFALPQRPKPEPSQSPLHPRERHRADVAILVSALCAAFTAWYAWDTHQMRLDAEKSGRMQAEEMKQARAAVEQSAKAAERSAEAAEKNISVFRELAATWRGSASDARAIARLDLEPEIRVYATLYPIKTPTGEIPPNILIKNVGPVEAVQVKLSLINIRRKGNTSGMGAMLNGDDEWSIDSLGPGRSTSIDASQALRGVVAIGLPHQNALRAEWRRDPDRKLFHGYLIFLLSPDGRWVGDNDTSVASEEYRSTRDLIQSHQSRFAFDGLFAVPLKAPSH
jgi:hypothetical protein